MDTLSGALSKGREVSLNTTLFEIAFRLDGTCTIMGNLQGEDTFENRWSLLLTLQMLVATQPWQPWHLQVEIDKPQPLQAKNPEFAKRVRALPALQRPETHALEWGELLGPVPLVSNREAVSISLRTPLWEARYALVP